ncbi:hypothetical protein XFF6166_880068 [Xanthomonas citri pv. fuscans]|nr:hypothetical protein XFF6166_880068 [Xanthomonas citri pv. fuscans]SOO04422.1 hypothetical protein XFF6960_970068 [Xanthomonas citri pv. fuscans]SOO07454.1 hypothetical protein XFF7767_970030 [Xanthomonas citri pv. fuscans]SOO08121.1 hypothetical protein XFF6970_150064 [Xanthomonas citri pv. fuscans]SOO13488.1 hypothetical protein XFF7766_180061 [Xanthomonas citri pv. fuscans]
MRRYWAQAVKLMSIAKKIRFCEAHAAAGRDIKELFCAALNISASCFFYECCCKIARSLRECCTSHEVVW